MPDLSSEFAEHYRAHFDFTWRNLRRLGVPATELDDAAQEVFVVLLRRRASIPPELPIRAWLFGVIRRIAWRYRRSDSRRSRLHDAVHRAANASPELERARARPDQLHDTREAARLVERFLAELTPIQAEVFVLAELEELSGKEIAEHLGVNQNTVWSRLRLARRAFDRRFATIRAESTRLYQRSPNAERRHPVLSLSRRGHRPSADDRRRVGALLGIPGFGALPQDAAGPQGAAAPGPGLPQAATAATTAGAPLAGFAGFAGAAAIAALVVGVGLSDRSASAVAPGAAAGVVTDAGERSEVGVRDTADDTADELKPAELDGAPSTSTSTPQRPLPSPPNTAAHRPSVDMSKGTGTGTGTGAGAGTGTGTGTRGPTEPAKELTQGAQPRSPTAEPGRPLDGEAAVAAVAAKARESALGAEYDLVAASRAALAGGDSRRSLALAERHSRGFPSGVLRDERDGLRIAALCQLGRYPEARRLADALALRQGDPAAIRRFMTECQPPAP